MRASCQSKQRLRIPWPPAFVGRRGYWLVACLSLAALFVQVSHPALHPLEIINPNAHSHLTCPVSHAAADLLLILPLPAPACDVFCLVIDPRLWLGCLDFDHCLAPRPPPTFPL